MPRWIARRGSGPYARSVRVGVLTGGGDCPGLNAVIRAIVRQGERVHGDEIVGFLDAWDGVRARKTMPLTVEAMRGTLPRGGTVLGTKRGSPFDTESGVEEVAATISDLGLDSIIVIGGNGSLTVACRPVRGARHADRRGAQDDRQRHRRHRRHVRVPHRRADRHRRHRPAAHDGREPRPGDGRRGDGSPQRVDRDLRRDRRRRDDRGDPRDPVRHRGDLPAAQPPPRAQPLRVDRRRRRGRRAGAGDDGGGARRRTTASATSCSAGSPT